MSRKVIIPILFLAFLACSTAYGQDDLQRARSARDAGQTAAAIDAYQKVLAAQPDNTDALGELSDVYDSATRWRDAIPLLEHLVQLQPQNAARVNQLGRYYSWTEDGIPKSLPLLQKAAELQPNNAGYRFDYADMLARKAETREQARRELRAILDTNPNYIPALTRLAEMLSWTGSSREEAGKLYQRGLAIEPNNLALLDGYGEMLSWSASTRPQAMKCFDQALAAHPGDPRALVGKAQLLAWSGHSDEALALYDQVLAANPYHPAALRGKAEILNWKGRNEQAKELLLKARNAAPDDPAITLELARVEAGLGNYAQARALMNRYPSESAGTDYSDMRQSVNRALGTWMEIGFIPRENREQLDYYRLMMLVSTPLGNSNRVTFGFRPTYFVTNSGNFNSNYYTVALDSRAGERVTTHAAIGVEQYPGWSNQVDGAFGIDWRISPGWTFTSGFTREAAEETYLSDHGVLFGGQTLGQARSNLANVGFGYANSQHHYDFSVTYNDGVYTSPVADSNRRWGVDFNIGKQIRSGSPYIRLSYGMTYLSFDHDADFEPGFAPNHLVGGYFSPTRFLVNYGGINASHHWGQKVEWNASGTLGVQNVETTTSDFGAAQFASSAETFFLWRPTSMNELRFGYQFLDVYNAFRRHVVSVSWRHYF